MKNPMNGIKHIKTSDVFDFNCVGFPASWSDVQILVCGRALRNYDDMKDNIDRLTEENAKLREALEQSSEVLRRQLSQYYYKDEVAMLNQYESNKQLLNQLKDQNNDK